MSTVCLFVTFNLCDCVFYLYICARDDDDYLFSSTRPNCCATCAEI